MRTAVVVYAGSVTRRAFEPLTGGASAYERVLGFAAALADPASILVLAGPAATPGSPHRSVSRPQWTDREILVELASWYGSAGEGVDAIVVVRGDEPFLDVALARKMLEAHRKYRADYSFADGYPSGLAADILHPRILSALVALAEKGPAEAARGWLFNVVQRDINAFDIETEIAPVDLRDRRIVLACDTKRNCLFAEACVAAGIRDAESALSILPGREDLLRTLPAFVSVQVTGGCPQSCSLCLWPSIGGDIRNRRDFMPIPRFAALMDGLAAFTDDAVIDLSPWGEPSLHPDFGGLVDAVLRHEGFSLIVETSGLGWKPGVLESVAARHQERLDWIVSLDAATPETYARLRGEGWDEAQATAGRIAGLWPRAFHPQLLRHRDNEEELEPFWRGWKARTEGVIVQKFSRFAGRLPEGAVADLSPLKRHACWHLRRDLTVLLDGSVPPCRDLTGAAPPLGGLFEGLGPDESGDGAFFEAAFARVWAKGEEWHRRHVGGDLPEACVNCDEYYTYNA